MKKNKILGSTLISFLIIFTLNACNDEDITSHPKDLGEPVKATEITSSSAILECKVWSNPRSITECGFEYIYAYTKDDSLRYADSNWDSYQRAISPTDIMSGDSTIIVKLEYLPENTLIFCRAYIHADNKYKYGKVMCFRTINFTASARTMNATQININKARLNGKIETNDLTNIYGFGFIFSENKGDVQACVSYCRYYTDENYLGAFYYDIDYLQSNTTYYYRTVISYYYGGELIDKYGDIFSFTTSNISIDLKTADYVFTGLLKVEVRGETTSNIEDYANIGFIVSSEKDTFSDNDIYFYSENTFIAPAWYNQNSNQYFSTIGYLLPNTTYYYAMYLENYGEYFFGETNTFTTNQVNITSLDASKITAHSALLSATYNNDSTYCYQLGFCLSSTTNEPSIDDCESNSTMDVQEKINYKDYCATASGLKTNTTYYYRPYIYSEDGTFYGETKTFTTTDTISVDGTVDLGLSVLWATDNLGATENNLTGNYYAWGETSPKNTFFINGYTIPNRDNIAGTQYDVATTTFGNGWRMPTKQEICELTEHCNMTVAIKNGTKGIKMTSLLTGQSVFFPYTSIKVDDMEESNFSVYFWTSNKYGNGQAISAEINDDLYLVYQAPYVETFAHYGLPIRPVYDPTIK